ncbi:MAG: aconitate hydratase [Verrucomicrobiota bacterium]|nr:aconitate hydratase [Verrucomicrobiota bacterium]
MPLPNPFNTLQSLSSWCYYSLPKLAQELRLPIERLPVSLRILLESLLRSSDEKSILSLANRTSGADIPFCVARVLLQDFTGVPLLVDLAAMRDAMKEKGFDPQRIEPIVPVDLVIDHSVQVDRAGTESAFAFNLDCEFKRNRERYAFLKWGQKAFRTFSVVPPGIGIVHQVHLEKIAPVVMEKEGVLFFDSVVGTDSHTTMINGLGVLGWGVGGIEAEAAMLGQPISLEIPEVIGFHLEGSLREGVTATDLTLFVTEILRKEKVVGKLIEFFGEGAHSLSVADRATIANMAPEYGATMGYFPVDEKTIAYLHLTSRPADLIDRIEAYWRAQGLFGMPKKGEIDYAKTLSLDLSEVVPSVAGPKRPQDRISLPSVQKRFRDLLRAEVSAGGYGKSESECQKEALISLAETPATDSGGSEEPESLQATWSEEEMSGNRPYTRPLSSSGYPERLIRATTLGHGSVVIAAITSCTNTSNPSVMIGAGLLAKKAVLRGLSVRSFVKTSLAPGSRVVTDYLKRAGLQPYLDALGFQLVAYGCTTCIGNSGPLDEAVDSAIHREDLVAASVLSGNRNFEARVHGSVKANFLMSPPLVVAYAIAGSVNIDLTTEPLGLDKEGTPVFLRDIWPSREEIEQTMRIGLESQLFEERYANVLQDSSPWDQIEEEFSAQYQWDEKSTYIRKPPYFADFSLTLPEKKKFSSLRALAIFGDSVTTDHISPAGAFSKGTCAGRYLLEEGVKESDFNSYGSRRGNHEVMVRGTFANVRVRNKLAGGKEGGWTRVFPEGELLPVYDASLLYAKRSIPLLVFAGKDYGMGSSRDWAAKGAALLGVCAVIAKSFERIHRSNLIGMGLLPLTFLEGEDCDTLGIDGTEVFALRGLEKIAPRQEVILEVQKEKEKKEVCLRLAIETPHEVEYYKNGGILPFVLRKYAR